MPCSGLHKMPLPRLPTAGKRRAALSVLTRPAFTDSASASITSASISAQFAPVPLIAAPLHYVPWYVIRFHGLTSLICGCGFPPHNTGFPARSRRVYYIGSPPSSRLFLHRISFDFIPPHPNDLHAILDGYQLDPITLFKRSLDCAFRLFVNYNGILHINSISNFCGLSRYYALLKSVSAICLKLFLLFSTAFLNMCRAGTPRDVPNS